MCERKVILKNEYVRGHEKYGGNLDSAFSWQRKPRSATTGPAVALVPYKARAFSAGSVQAAGCLFKVFFPGSIAAQGSRLAPAAGEGRAA